MKTAAAFLPSEELAVQQSALEEAQKELQENEQKLAEEMAKAQLQFDDARADIEAIRDATVVHSGQECTEWIYECAK